MISRRFLAVALAASGLVGGAQAMILFDQSPDTGSVNATSWSNWTQSQNFADKVLLSQNAVVTDYDYFTNFNPATFGTMQVKLLADAGGTPGAYLSTQNIAATSYFNYGTYGGQTIYEVDLALTTPWALTAGTTYWVGASGNGFEAAQVSMLSDTNPLADGMMAQFQGSTFQTMTGGGIGDQAFALEGKPSAVPEPASMAALAIGGAALIRRRRQK